MERAFRASSLRSARSLSWRSRHPPAHSIPHFSYALFCMRECPHRRGQRKFGKCLRNRERTRRREGVQGQVVKQSSNFHRHIILDISYVGQRKGEWGGRGRGGVETTDKMQVTGNLCRCRLQEATRSQRIRCAGTCEVQSAKAS